MPIDDAEDDHDLTGPRLELARRLAVEAAAMGMRYFKGEVALAVELKGPQDVVSAADREIEQWLRSRIQEAFPADGIVGEEYSAVSGESEYIWVLDPIDGTAGFVSGTPIWSVVIACQYRGETEFGVIHDPNHGESFWARRGQGAYLNGSPLQVDAQAVLTAGVTGVSFSGRDSGAMIVSLLAELIDRGGVFLRLPSGAISLAYVAAGRLIGFCETQMNAWDCLAGLLLIREAGGQVMPWPQADVLERGMPIVAAAPGVYPDLLALARRHYPSDRVNTAGPSSGATAP